MPTSLKSINEKLYGMLHTNGFDPTPLDSSGDEAGIPEEAELFQVVTKNGVPVTVTITSDRILQIRYSTKATEDEGWYAPDGLLKKVRDFVRQHRLRGFEPDEQNDNKNLKYDMAKRAKMKREELSLNEGYYAINKRSSYNNSIPEVKIVIQHSRQIEEGEQRFRNVEKIFIENVDGERFRSPTNSPGLSKIFARLIAEGDKPHGENWNHLISLVEDYTKLRGFVRATKNGVFNESAQKWIQAGVSRYTELRESLKSLMSSRGYRNYFENYTPTLNEGSADNGLDLTEMFKSSVLDSRVEAALPVIKRLSVGLSEEVNLASPLEEWAGQIERDAVYGVEDNKVLDEECNCGPDCDCPDCKEHNPKVKKNFSIRESRLNFEQIEKEFGQIHYKGGIFSRNQLLFQHLIEHFGTDNRRASDALMYIVNQKIELDHKFPLSEEINKDDSLLNNIFDTFENYGSKHQYKKGDNVVALEMSAMPFGNPKEVWIEGSYTPYTIENITPDYIEFTNGKKKPFRKIVQLRLWNQLVLFDNPEDAERAITWMIMMAGDRDDWTLKVYIDSKPYIGLEESYGGQESSRPYGRSIMRGDFVKDNAGNIYHVFGVHGSTLTVKPYLNNNYGEQKDIQLTSVKLIQKPKDFKVAAESKNLIMNILYEENNTNMKIYPIKDIYDGGEIKFNYTYDSNKKNTSYEVTYHDSENNQIKFDSKNNVKTYYGINKSKGMVIDKKMSDIEIYNMFEQEIIKNMLEHVNNNIPADDDRTMRLIKMKPINENNDKIMSGIYEELKLAKDHFKWIISNFESNDNLAIEGKLTPGQKRSGQVDATEKAKSTGPILGKPEKKHPWDNRLVGASESVENNIDDSPLNEGVIDYVDIEKFKPGVKVQHQYFPEGGIVLDIQGSNIIVKVTQNDKERLFRVPPQQLKVMEPSEHSSKTDELSELIRLTGLKP